LGLVTELVDLNVGFDAGFDTAKVLVIRRGAQFILGEETDALIAENDALTMDKKAFMKGKVVNKVARWNLCFADEDQEPNYEDGKGRIVSWAKIPKMARIRQVISEWTEDVLLNGEANYYYDISKCGIGYHGDGERKKVFAVRMGETMPLYFQWFQRSLPVGTPFEVVLNDGDMYIMSEKAVGFDWLKKITPTLRHSTGCKKFTEYTFKKNTFKKGVAKNHEQLEADKAQKLAIIEADKEAKKAEIAAKKTAKTLEIAAKKEAKRLELEAKKTAKTLEITAKKEAKRIELEAKKLAKTLEITAKKEAKKLEIEAKKNNKKK
jgi:hypothetical protein